MEALARIGNTIEEVSTFCHFGPHPEAFCSPASVGNGWECMYCSRPMENVKKSDLIRAVRYLVTNRVQTKLED